MAETNLGRLVVKGNVYIVGSQEGRSCHCNYDPCSPENTLANNVQVQKPDKIVNQIYDKTITWPLNPSQPLINQGGDTVRVEEILCTGKILSSEVIRPSEENTGKTPTQGTIKNQGAPWETCTNFTNTSPYPS